MEYIERRLPLRFIDGNLGASCVVDEGRKSGEIFQFLKMVISDYVNNRVTTRSKCLLAERKNLANCVH